MEIPGSADSKPLTMSELKTWMKENFANFLSYSIGGNDIDEGFILDHDHTGYHWIFTERGSRDIHKSFVTEAEAVTYAYQQIKGDTWAWSHCIGFTPSEDEHRALAKILNEMGIEFLQDRINYFANRPGTYRTFVFGKDKLRTLHLAEKYFKKNS